MSGPKMSPEEKKAFKKRLKDKLNTLEQKVAAAEGRSEGEPTSVMGVMTQKKEGRDHIVVMALESADRDLLASAVAEHLEEIPHEIEYLDDYPVGQGAFRTGGWIHREAGGLWGTAGGFFRHKDTSNPSLFGISNCHVVANCGDAEKGDWLETREDRHVARLLDFVPLKPWPTHNWFDAAIFMVHPNADAQPGFPQPKGFAPIANVRFVYKVGAATNGRKGEIDGSLPWLDVRLCGTMYRFGKVYKIKGVNGLDFSDEGDSGALVMTRNDYLAGILFAKDHRRGISFMCSPFVLNRWDLRI